MRIRRVRAVAFVVSVALVGGACGSPEVDSGWGDSSPPEVPVAPEPVERTAVADDPVAASDLYDPCGRFVAMHADILAGEPLSTIVEAAAAWHRDAEALGAGGDLVEAAEELSALVLEHDGEIVDVEMLVLVQRVIGGWQGRADEPLKINRFLDDPGDRAEDCNVFSLEFDAVVSALDRCVAGLAEFADEPIESPPVDAPDFWELVEQEDRERLENVRTRELWRDCAMSDLVVQRLGVTRWLDAVEGYGERLVSMAGPSNFRAIGDAIDAGDKPPPEAADRRVVDVDAPVAIPIDAAANYEQALAVPCIEYNRLVGTELADADLAAQLDAAVDWLESFEGTFIDASADLEAVLAIRDRLDDAGWDVRRLEIDDYRTLLITLGTDLPSSRLSPAAHMVTCPVDVVTSAAATALFERCLLAFDSAYAALLGTERDDPADLSSVLYPVAHQHGVPPLCGAALDMFGDSVTEEDIRRVLARLSPEALEALTGS